jgi:hypothetical protein
MIEVWAPIAGFEGLYEVSTHGRVRPARLPEVNHKDEDRANPKLDNLEWSTVSDNRKNQRRWRK